MHVSHYLARWRLRGYRAQLELQSAAAEVEVTRELPCVITVKNAGRRTWQASGAHPVRLSYHWRVGAQAIEGIRFSLPSDIRPGGHAVIECAVPVPSAEGRYVLEFDLVCELVGWFAQNGSPTLSIDLAASSTLSFGARFGLYSNDEISRVRMSLPVDEAAFL